MKTIYMHTILNQQRKKKENFVFLSSNHPHIQNLLFYLGSLKTHSYCLQNKAMSWNKHLSDSLKYIKTYSKFILPKNATLYSIKIKYNHNSIIKIQIANI